MKDTNKKCVKCGQIKPLNRFTLRTDTGNYRNKCKDCVNIERRASPNYGKWHKENKDRLKIYQKDFDLKRHYGITLECFKKMLKSQKGKCLICKTEEPGGRHNTFHVDHCHKTGKVRALLCSKCNVGLGAFGDSLVNLKRAYKYVKKHRYGEEE